MNLTSVANVSVHASMSHSKFIGASSSKKFGKSVAGNIYQSYERISSSMFFMANSVVQIAGLALISDHSAKDSGVWRQCTV